MQKSILALLTFIILTSCSPKNTDTKTKSDKMNPGYAKISATVLKFEAILDSARSEKPCGQTPCYAQVRIDSVHGYGSAFGSPLVSGSTITLKFMYTLEATSAELFPNLKEHLPGLNIGSKFRGNIQVIENSNRNSISNDEKLYRIFGYHLID